MTDTLYSDDLSAFEAAFADDLPANLFDALPEPLALFEGRQYWSVPKAANFILSGLQSVKSGVTAEMLSEALVLPHELVSRALTALHQKRRVQVDEDGRWHVAE